MDLGQNVTELNFKGKEFVYNHHLAVPFRPLVPDASKGIGDVALDGNLIIHGDNLHALKALVPLYAGKVDCIFIDPPYNTGNEGWAYNDNVNAPMIKEWLEANPIGIEDGLRHDKWCAMMWPRLRLLHELLSDTGSFWMTLDDNEVHRAKLMMDQIFGEGNFIGDIIWEKRFTRNNDAKLLSSVTDHVLLYRKSGNLALLREPRNKKTDSIYSNPDNDFRGDWTSVSYISQRTKEQRKNLSYEVYNPITNQTLEHSTNAWKYSKDQYDIHVKENRLYWGKEGGNQYPRLKRFLAELNEGVVPVNLWNYKDTGTIDDGTKTVDSIIGKDNFDYPKPVELISRILEISTTPNSLILDSFAGSGTTAHAVLAANAKDGGTRRFICVEMEDYADTLTAERVRRVINGYAFKGTQKTELHREKLSFSSLKKADEILQKINALENLEAHKFDAIKKELKDGELIVTGEKTVQERAQGLGGTFTYCTLGAPLELDRLLTGENLPSYAGLGAALFHMATNRAFDPAKMNEAESYLGESEGQHVWMIYKPELDWLKSPEAALTLNRAKAFAAIKPDKKHLVFAAARYVSQKLLSEENVPVEFVPLPYALYRIERV